MKARKATIKRKTSETDIQIEFTVDGKGSSKIDTQIPFLDHMLALLAKHGLFDLKLKARGDLECHTARKENEVSGTGRKRISKA